MDVPDAPQITRRAQPAGRSIADALKSYKETAELRYSKKSQSKYTNALNAFQSWGRDRDKTHLVQLGREDVIDFMGHLVAKQGLDHSTAVDKGRIVHGVMNNYGAEIRMKRGDWPKLVDQEIEVYEPAELEALFAAATVEEYVLFQTFLLTGFREQEVGFLAWDDLNARRRTLGVSQKVGMGLKPKNKQERTVPIPEFHVELLLRHRKTLPAGSYLVFPTSDHNAKKGLPGGQRDRHMLDRLKKLAMRAGMNCGRCVGTWRKKPATCKDRPICTRFGLHKFRHTYATTLLRDGVDLVSLQKLMGHSDLESTRKYLRALEPDDLHAKLAKSSLATRVFHRSAA